MLPAGDTAHLERLEETMKKTLTILALSSFTAAGAVYAQNASESVTDPMADSEMMTETARDTAVDTVVTGNGEPPVGIDFVLANDCRADTDPVAVTV